MAKGQKRGNREAKKPKAAKKPAPVAASPFIREPLLKRPAHVRGDT
jgi:hypothetical protein